MHSARNPEKEAERFAQEIVLAANENPDTAILIVGIGWGYHVESILRALPGREVIFHEPIVEVREVLEPERIASLRELGARVIEQPEELPRLPGYGDRPAPLLIRVFPAYQRLFPDLAGAVAMRLETVLASPSRAGAARGIDDATTARFMRQWTRNFFITLRELDALEFIKPPEHSSPNTTVLYCGAGPGLLADLEPRLSELQSADRGILVLAADSALAPLLHLGIRPDLVLSVDSGRGTAYHYRAGRLVAAAMGLDGFTPDAPMPLPVLSWTAGPRFARRWFKSVVYYRSTLPFDQVLGETLLKDIPEWKNSARNPAGLALLFTGMIGARRLQTAGADFRSRGDKSHERGTGYTLYALDGVNRTKTLEMYRPGGYGEAPAGKNRLALQGLTEMAAALGVEVSALSRDDSPPEDPSTRYDFQTHVVSAESARGHLGRMWTRMDFRSLPGSPDDAQIRKWRALLEASGS